MRYNSHRHHRRSIRLKEHDYTRSGYYFVTICTSLRKRLFDDAALRRLAEEQWQALDRAGLRGRYQHRVSVDTWIVMPDHVHGIIVIDDNNDGVDGGHDGDHDEGAQQPGGDPHTNIYVAAAPLRPADGTGRWRGDGPSTPPTDGTYASERNEMSAHQWDDLDYVDDRELDLRVMAGSLGAIVRSYKAAVTRRVNQRRRVRGVSIWQRGYYERILRDEHALHAVRRYIANNPAHHAARLDALLARMQYKEER